MIKNYRRSKFPKIFILSFYSGVVDRGVETLAAELSRRLSNKFQLVVFQTGEVKNNIDSLEIVRIKYQIGNPKANRGLIGKFYLDNQSLRILFCTLKLLPTILKEKPAIIFPLNGGWQTLIMRVLSKFTKSKLIISGQAGIGGDDAWNLSTRPDTFLALTTAQLSWANKLAPEVKVILIPNGVDLAKFNPKVKPQAVPLKGKIVICASALDQYKRVDLTIKAVAKTNLSLLVLGDGQLRGQIDNLGKRLLGQRYARMVIPHSQMPNYYRTGDVFTLASKTEAFGISYIEAMACNLPVVATADASREEIIGRAGVLTHPENIEKYAKDLQIAANTNYRSIPYNQSLKYSWNIIAQKYTKLINKLISEK